MTVDKAPVVHFDHHAPEFVDQADQINAALREQAPVCWSDTFEHLPEGVKPWANLWSAGQGIELIEDIPSVADLVLRLRREYVEACQAPDMAKVARLVEGTSPPNV
jgi:NAD(P)H-dependent flavin oxidoreductase YrpB (nitropropane dioxygenase family)